MTCENCPLRAPVVTTSHAAPGDILGQPADGSVILLKGNLTWSEVPKPPKLTARQIEMAMGEPDSSTELGQVWHVGDYEIAWDARGGRCIVECRDWGENSPAATIDQHFDVIASMQGETDSPFFAELRSRLTPVQNLAGEIVAYVRAEPKPTPPEWVTRLAADLQSVQKQMAEAVDRGFRKAGVL